MVQNAYYIHSTIIINISRNLAWAGKQLWNVVGLCKSWYYSPHLPSIMMPPYKLSVAHCHYGYIYTCTVTMERKASVVFVYMMQLSLEVRHLWRRNRTQHLALRLDATQWLHTDNNGMCSTKCRCHQGCSVCLDHGPETCMHLP